MAQYTQDSSIIDAVELLKDNGLDALAEAITVLMSTTMVVKRSEERWGYSNGLQPKTVEARLGELPLRVP